MNRIGDNLIHFGANERIICAFSQSLVEFIVVGGLAVAWYCDTRQADDMDLLVNPTAENSTRIWQVFNSLRLSGYHKLSFVKSGLQVVLKGAYYADILTPRENDPTYLEAIKGSVDAKLFDFPVRVVSAAMLIQMKKSAVSSLKLEENKHLNDIALLQTHV